MASATQIQAAINALCEWCVKLHDDTQTVRGAAKTAILTILTKGWKGGGGETVPLTPQDLRQARCTVGDWKGWTPLGLAAYCSRYVEGLEVVARLLEAGCPVNGRNVYGNTALYRAAVNGAFATAHRLLDAGADPAIPGNDRYLPIHWAAWSSSADATLLFTRLALLAPHTLRERNDDLETPLHRATRLGTPQMCDLAARLAPETLDWENENGRTALWYALANHWEAHALTLLWHGASPDHPCLAEMQPRLREYLTRWASQPLPAPGAVGNRDIYFDKQGQLHDTIRGIIYSGRLPGLLPPLLKEHIDLAAEIVNALPPHLAERHPHLCHEVIRRCEAQEAQSRA